MTINDRAASTAAQSNSSIESMNGNSVQSSSSDGRKKLHGRAFYESIGSPKFVLAPMVDQSEFVCLTLHCTGRNILTAIGLANANPLLHATFLPSRYPCIYTHAARPHVQRNSQIPRLAFSALPLLTYHPSSNSPQLSSFRNVPRWKYTIRSSTICTVLRQ